MKSLKNELFKLWTTTIAFLPTLEREQPSQHNTVLLFSCKVLLFMTLSLTDAFSPHLMRLYHSSIQGDLLFSRFTLVALSCLCACLKDLWEPASLCNVSSVLHVYHLYGVKTRVRPLAEVHCLGSRFKKLDCAKDWHKKGKSCQVYRASFVRHLSTINDWHISCHFPLLFAAIEFESK